MSKRQYMGIKYPFQNNNDQGYFVDLNLNKKDKTRSDLLHLLFTPKGQKIRYPEFGTDLIRFIFNPNDSESWEAIKTEIKEEVALFLPYVTLDNIEVVSDDSQDFQVIVKISFTVKEGNTTVYDSVAVTI